MSSAVPSPVPSAAPSTEASRRVVVVGVDGSAASVAALRWAGRAGGALGLEIDAVVSWSFPPGYGLGGVVGGWDPAEDADAVVRDAVAAAFGDEPPAGLRRHVQVGQAAHVLLGWAGSTSREAELLVVGSRGHGGFTGLLLGSTSVQCVTHARCPVVVVHADPPVVADAG